MTRREHFLAMVADRPEGERVDLSALARAFTPNVSTIARAIESLIADGLLDSATLRRPPCAETQTDQKCLIETPAEVPEPKPAEPPAPKAVAEGGGDARKVTPPPIEVSGPELLVLLDKFISDHGLARGAVSQHLFGSSGNISLLRYTRRPRAATVAKVSAFLASNPPDDLRKKPRTYSKPNSPGSHAPADGEVADKPRPPLNRDTKGASAPAREARSATESTVAETEQPVGRIEDRASTKESAPLNCPSAAPARPVDIKVNRRRDPTAPPDLPLTELRDRQIETTARQVAARKRTIRKQAQAFLDAGVPSHKAGSQEMRGAMLEIQQRQEEAARRADPVEQAKSILSRRYSPVYSAEVSGGPKGKFFVGRKLVTRLELLDMARRFVA